MGGAKQILILLGLIVATLFVSFAIISTIIDNLIGFFIFALVGIGVGGWFFHNNFKNTELPESEKQNHVRKGALLGFLVCFVVAIVIFSPTHDCSRDIGKYASIPKDC